MLVLTRKLNESIVINNQTTVTVMSLHSGRVKLAITAPRHVKVNRREVELRDEEKKRGNNNAS